MVLLHVREIEDAANALPHHCIRGDDQDDHVVGRHERRRLPPHEHPIGHAHEPVEAVDVPRRGVRVAIEVDLELRVGHLHSGTGDTHVLHRHRAPNRRLKAPARQSLHHEAHRPVDRVRAHRVAGGGTDDDSGLVAVYERGGVMESERSLARVLSPARSRAGVPHPPASMTETMSAA